MTLVDLIILVAAAIYGIGGYRNGAVVGFFSLAGFLGGASIGAQIAKPVSSHVASDGAQVPVAIICVLGSAVLVQLVAVYIGGQLRGRIRWRSAQAVDRGIGALLGVLAVLVVSWMVAFVVQSSPYPSLNASVRNSFVVGAVQDVMPQSVRNLYSRLEQFIKGGNFPDVLPDLQGSHIVGVNPPDPALLSSAGVTADRQSVFKIYGTAPQCNRDIEGSGFVYAPQHILTNAHVVAGTSQVQVVVGNGEVTAHVVLYDPRRDVAVLYVPGLTAPALTFAPSPAGTGADAVVLGYPLDQGFDVRAARVRSRTTISGPDIYSDATVDREVYSIRGLVRSGNSGGPLITPAGQVLGIVFATAVDSSDTGFVLTDSEVSADAASGRIATAGVGTQGCTPG